MSAAESEESRITQCLVCRQSIPAEALTCPHCQVDFAMLEARYATGRLVRVIKIVAVFLLAVLLLVAALIMAIND